MTCSSRRRRTRSLTLIVLTLAACRDAARHPARAHEAESRRFARALADTAWVVELGTDSTVASPAAIAVDRDQLYVADDVARTVSALDIQSGRTRWTTPIVADNGDSVVPLTMSASRRGGVIVGDMRGSTLWHMPARGGRATAIALSTGHGITRFCELSDSTLLVTPDLGRRDLYLFTRAGALRAARPIPWPTLRSAPELLLQFNFASTPDGCVVGLSLGLGFTWLSDRGFASPRPYVEAAALPAVDSTVTVTPDGRTVETHLRSTAFAVIDAAATSTRLVFAFGGHSAGRNHLIDLYDRDGGYVESFRTRTAVGALAANDSGLFLLTRRHGNPVVVALRWPR